MTSRLWTQAAALVRKELREAIRMGWKYALATLAFSTYIQWFITRNYVSMARKAAASETGTGLGPEELLQLAPAFSLIFVAPIVIPFVANGILSRSLIKERLLGSLMTLLATGVDTGLVWTGKVLAAFAFGYVVSLVALAIDTAMIQWYFDLEIVWSLSLVLTALVIAPLAALAVLAVMSFLFWTVRPAHIIASTLPVLTSMVLFGYVAGHPVRQVLMGGIAAAAGMAVLVMAACAFGITRLSRRFVVGL